MENGENYNRSRGAASRPPEWERSGEDDIPLFTEIPLSSVRRAPRSGRPDVAFTQPASRSAASANANPYGARIAAPRGRNDGTAGTYTAPRYQSQFPSQRESARPAPAQPARPVSGPAPTYTEISWDSLRSGADLSALAAQPPRETRPVQPTPQETPAQAATPYFGGFSREMDDLFYGSASTPAGGGSYGGTSAPAKRSAAATQPRPENSSGRGGLLQSLSHLGRNHTSRSTARRSEPAGPLYPSVGQHGARPASPRQTASAARRSAQPAARPAAPRGSYGTRTPSSGAGTPPYGGPVNYAARPRKRGIHPAFYVAGLVLLALLILLVSRLVNSSRSSKPRPVAATATPEVTVAPEVTPTPDPLATPSPTPFVTPVPRPTPAATPVPAGAKAARYGTRIIPADWGPVVPERKTAVYDSHFDKSVMIGNSLVEGFFMWSGMTNIKYIYDTGAVVSAVLGRMDLSPLTMNPGRYTDIYLMFGLNEIGTDVNSFVTNYKKLIDFIRESQPDANIYVVSVTPVTDQVDKDPNEVQSMDRIDKFNAALKEFCADEKIWYLDIYSMLLDEWGYLSADYAYAGDGKHFEKSGYVAWANYMKTHYVDEGLLTE